MKRSLSAAVFLIIVASSIAGDVYYIQCSYKQNQQIFSLLATNFTTCDLQSNLLGSEVITNAFAYYDIIPNTAVQIFTVNGKHLSILPRGLNVAFQNLIGIKIENSNFLFLDSEVLKEIKGLRYLGIIDCDLFVILENIFSYNDALELIDLSGNPILFIAPTAFDNLLFLEYLSVGGILCLKGLPVHDGVGLTGIANLKIELDAECSIFSNINMALFTLSLNIANYKQNLVLCEEERNDYQAKNSYLEQYFGSVISKMNRTIEELEDRTCFPSGTCIFKTISWDYSCVAKLYVKSAFEQNISWTGTHDSGRSNDEVEYLLISSQVMEVFPLNIGETFENLKNLTVRNSGLTKIRVNDFRGLSKLEILEITGNNIAFIDASSFSGLTSLQRIDLSSNNITVLPRQIFEFLLDLKIINLSNNKLKEVRFDTISSANSIEEVYLANNAIVPLDRTFIWRLQKANSIDLSGTGCPHSWDKLAGSEMSFYNFYTNIIVNC